MKNMLIINSYPQHLINRYIRKVEVVANKRKSQQQQSNKIQHKEKVYFLFSYYGQESMILAQRIKRLSKTLLSLIDITVCF